MSDLKKFTFSLDKIMHHSMLALEYIKENNSAGARQEIDTLRLFRATLGQEFLADFANTEQDTKTGKMKVRKIFIKGEDLKLYNSKLEIYAKAQSIIENWIHRFDETHTFDELMQSDEGVDCLIDTFLPSTWNFNKELVFLFSKHATKIAHRLRIRGQRNILIFSEEKKHIPAFPTFSEAWEIEQKLITMPIKPTLAVGLEPKDIIFRGDLRKKIEIVHEELIKRVKTNLMEEETIVGIGAIVPQQKVINSVHIALGYSIEHCRPFIENKPVIVVSPGPSLQNDIEQLKSNRENVIIFAVAQACPALSKHDISPDLVCVVDPIDYSEVLKDVDTSRVKALVLGDGVHPNFYSTWPLIKKVILPSDFAAFNNAAYVKNPTFDWMAGSVSVSALKIAVGLKASVIGLMGQDLSISSGSYYNYLGENYDPDSTEAQFWGKDKDENLQYHDGRYRRLLPVPANDGGEVNTTDHYWSYILQIENLLKASSIKCKVFNFSKSGALIQGADFIPFKEFLKKSAYVRIDNSQHLAEHFMPDCINKLQTLKKHLDSQRKLVKKFHTLSKKYNKSFSKKVPDNINYEFELMNLTKSVPVLEYICANELRDFRYKTQASHDTVIKIGDIKRLSQGFMTRSFEYMSNLTKGIDNIDTKLKKISNSTAKSSESFLV